MRSSYPCQLSLDAHVVLGLVSSTAVLTDALTLVPSPTDRDATDLKTRTKFTAQKTMKGGEHIALTNPNATCINTFIIFLVWVSQKLLSFQCKFSSKTKVGISLRAHSCKIISKRMILKYNQQWDINRLLGCLSGAHQALCPGRMLTTMTTYFIWANQSHGN